VSVIIGLILASTTIWLAVETKGLLIGESTNSEVSQGIKVKNVLVKCMFIEAESRTINKMGATLPNEKTS